MFIKIIFAVVAIALALLVWKNLQQPENLGVSDGRLAILKPTPNGVSTQAIDPEQKIEALPWGVPDAEEVRERILQVLQMMGGNQVMQQDNHYLHVVFTTQGLRFKDDVEIYLNSETQEVEYRSQSRVGVADLGVNRERYQQFQQAYREMSF